MKNAIILHGRPDDWEYYGLEYPAQSNSHWIPWLQKQLQVKDIFTQTPEIPISFKPDYKVWEKEFERYDTGPETILVGHSCGGGFIVRWLSEHKETKVGKVVLVAPWINPGDKPESETGSFFHFDIDPNLSERTKKTVIFRSSNDVADVLETIDILREKIKNIEIREFKNYGHFCKSDLGTEAFPELLEECLKGNT